MFLGIVLHALAETAGTLEGGSGVIYGGPAASTYAHLAGSGAPGSGGRLARALQARLDLYGAVGLSDRVQVGAYVPLVYSTVVERLSNCDNEPDFCAPVATVGMAGVQGRVRVLDAPLRLTLGLGVSSGHWNADVRQRYTAVGESTTDVQPAVYAGHDLRFGRLVAFAAYTNRHALYARDVVGYDGEVPADDLRGGLELHLRPGDLGLQVGAYTYQRLGGLALGDDWYDSGDRWAVLDYDNVSVGAKLSVPLPANMGLHVGVTQVVWVHNGPPDATDLTVGVHKWFPSAR
ncbi:MAG: hypothetical protein ACOZNI_14575 [Myxococcota bacterium]